MKLSMRKEDDLKWIVEKTPSFFEFDLGLDDPLFSLEDELYFQSLVRALKLFREEIFSKHPASRIILYRGSFDFTPSFTWTEKQEKNLSDYKQKRPFLEESHLKRLFCLESYLYYFQMLSAYLPDEIKPEIIFTDPLKTVFQGEISFAKVLHLLSLERFEHFKIESPYQIESNEAVCFPMDESCSENILKVFNRFFEKKGISRAVYELFLTEGWAGLDRIYVLENSLKEMGERALLGFEAAGGEVIKFGAEGFEPPTYWSQTSRASQTALCPENQSPSV